MGIRPYSGDVSSTPPPAIHASYAELQRLTDASPDGYVYADADGVVRIINAQAQALLGTDLASSLGDTLEHVLRLQDQQGRSWVAENGVYTGLRITTGVPEQSWLNEAGEEVLTTARIVREVPLGPVQGVGVAIRSGRGRARLDRDRSDLVATLAHELRSPLTGVKGFVTALLNRWDKLTDDQRKLMLQTVKADSDRLTRLIAELLDVARIDTGRLQMHVRDVDPLVLAQRVVGSVGAGTARQITVVAGEDVGEVFADPDKYTQVLTNLVENAVRHGEGLVSVELSRVVDPWPGVRIVVTDEGPGIDEELRRRIFTKFWTSGASAGSGLGMYIVGGLCRAHGAEVTVGEREGGGARIDILWPCDDRRGM